MTAEQQKQDWQAWHKPYDEPGSRLARRLAVVQARLREALTDRTGPVGLISMCAGQGRDVIPVLAAHPRRDDVEALLVELDPRNAEAAQESAQTAGLSRVSVMQGDAALTDNYAAAAPADIVLACGIFGNISDEDIENTVRHLPMLCAPGATVLWTRGVWKDLDPTPKIRRWFEQCGFEELSFEASVDDTPFTVGANRYIGEPRPLERGLTLFTFFR